MKNHIRKYREQLKLTQHELGKQLGVTQATIGLYERGLREPNFEMTKKLATALQCSPADLFPVLAE
ncbi:hypothetical protein BMT54_06355 [Pasteurellaceae bacterium 15-036681]|nr:hypothetical protein BMT54_06355 [Pasteurellaceae bacterium 15-036681]